MNKVTLPLSSANLFCWQYFLQSKKSLILCCYDDESALEGYHQLRFLAKDNSHEIIYLPSLDTVPYDRVSPRREILSQRAAALTSLASSASPRLTVTNISNILAKLPPRSLFLESILKLKKGDSHIDINMLASFLVKNGFVRVSTAIENSEFAMRGEIADFVTEGVGYRLTFAWGKLESIREFDPTSQISRAQINEVSITPASELLLVPDTIANFKKNFLKFFGVNYINHPLYESICSGSLFQGAEHLLPLFYEDMSCLLDFMPSSDIIYDNLSLHSLEEYVRNYQEFYRARNLTNKSSPGSFYFTLPVENMIMPLEKAKSILQSDRGILLESGEHKEFHSVVNIASNAKLEKKTECAKLLEVIQENTQKIPVIFCNSTYTKERLKSMLATYENCLLNDIEYLPEAKKHQINITLNRCSGSFASKDYIFFTEQDILGRQISEAVKISSRKKLQNILTELDNIVEGELVVHKEHGIGRFEKIETMYVENIPHDCLKIIYANNDILYLPVENIDQFKKFGHGDADLDRLGAAHWQQRKARLKNRIREIAKDLVKLSAARQLSSVKPIYFEDQSYSQFCEKFPYSETGDQLSAIENIKEDLESGSLMDRLICGDVGFGKTEVAMRAAFMAAADLNSDAPQVVVIAPTTILCRQHYQNFLERFNNTGIKIAQLSRLVKPSEAKKVKEAIKSGEVNIIIGTHALLAGAIEFYNLRLLIIDEEQHFGVAQKEHLKKLKTGVHVLSLSATPIPRTLQMSMIGIKELSLIATPPIDRLPVRTHVLPFDSVVIRDALMRERFRGGLSFVVVPKIKDIEWISKQLDKAVPELKYRVAHGQMPANEIDKIMNDFCDKQFDILLSTTIIESGIDISIANTIIIHRADYLGLGQLYQLRGRVGRGKERGYAYLTLGQNKITKQSMQRLELLQNIESLGAGFTIASHDMDMRGFGNLVGDEQSGHIKEVGAELYQEMLDEAILELKNSKDQSNIVQEKATAPNINLGLAILIPHSYIEDSSLRLVIYRRAGSLKNAQEIENFKIEMIDRFGPIPAEFLNLLELVQLKNECIDLSISSVDAGPNGFVLKFQENADVSKMALGFIALYPRHCQIKQNTKLVVMRALQGKDQLYESKKLLQELRQCANIA